MYKYFFVVFLISGCFFKALAQKPDTTASAVKSKADTIISAKKDTAAATLFKPNHKKRNEKTYHPDSTHSPHKAIMRSLMVPGWGQLYNGQWYLVPPIYAGLGLLGWAFVFNNNYYHEFLTLSQYRYNGIVPVPGQSQYNNYMLYINVPSQSIYDANDAYRRDRDLSILGFVGAWAINVIDAYVEAKFQNAYTVDNKLSMKVNAGFLNQFAYVQNANSSFIPALKLTFTIK